MIKKETAIEYILKEMPQLKNEAGFSKDEQVLKQLLSYFKNPSENQISLNSILDLNKKSLKIALHAINIYSKNSLYTFSQDLDSSSLIDGEERAKYQY